LACQKPARINSGCPNSLQFEEVFHRSHLISATDFYCLNGILPATVWHSRRPHAGVDMLLTVNLQSATLDLPTLSLVAVCIAGLLGVFLIIDWLQQRNVRALAWWGSAYLIGAAAMALASMPDPIIALPSVVPGAVSSATPEEIAKFDAERMFTGAPSAAPSSNGGYTIREHVNGRCVIVRVSDDMAMTTVGNRRLAELALQMLVTTGKIDRSTLDKEAKS